MLYRGQRYGERVGEWWTTDRDEAVSFGMSRGSNRHYVVLALDEDDAEWLAQFLQFDRSGRGGDWYRIPSRELAKRWHGVKVESGAIGCELFAKDLKP
jgi:hypothetical protein